VPGNAQLDITVAWVQPKWEVRFNANNIADDTYYVGGYQKHPEPRAAGRARATTR
jgi:outer membrane receptor protein involved in Fe transport